MIKMCLIKIENLYKSFGNQEVLKNISLQVNKNEFLTLLGSSGCGKSTLLRSIAGFIVPDSGKIFIAGEDISNLSPRERNIGMIFQNYSLFPSMTVEENIKFGLDLKNLSENEKKEKINNVLQVVHMKKHANKYPSQLSGGEKQRVALARSLVVSPKVMLLDEPFSAVDAKLRKLLQKEFRDIHNKVGMTSIFVTHDQEEAMILSDRIAVMRDGIIEQIGTPEELYKEPKNKFVASFIGDNNIIESAKLRDLLGLDDKSINSYQWYSIRPEKIMLNRDVESKPTRINLEGKISSVKRMGSVIRYHVNTTIGELISDSMLSKVDENEKETVCVSFDINDLLALKE